MLLLWPTKFVHWPGPATGTSPSVGSQSEASSCSSFLCTCTFLTKRSGSQIGSSWSCEKHRQSLVPMPARDQGHARPLSEHPSNAPSLWRDQTNWNACLQLIGQSNPIFFKYLFIYYVYSILSVCISTGQKRAPDLITDGCEPPCGCRELNSGPLEE